jgi:hypothetical protein
MTVGEAVMMKVKGGFHNCAGAFRKANYSYALICRILRRNWTVKLQESFTLILYIGEWSATRSGHLTSAEQDALFIL